MPNFCPTSSNRETCLKPSFKCKWSLALLPSVTHEGKATGSSNVIVSLLKARDGKLWVGTFWEGLNCFDGHKFIYYKNRPGDMNSLANNNVWSLAEDRDGNIWIGTLGGGLQCLNPKTGIFITYNLGNSGIISNHIVSICITHGILIATSSR